jgi:hypothetical protein
MTQEEKDIVLHGARFELMNTCINFNDGTVDREKMMNVMQKYAEMYHYNELSKLSQHDVSVMLKSFVSYAKSRSISDININDDTIEYFIKDFNLH